MNQYHKIHGLYKRYREGENKGQFIMGEYSRPEFELLKDIQWVWTEKVDGTNIRIIYTANSKIQGLGVKGKTDKAEIPKHLFEHLKNTLTIEKFEKVFNKEEQLDVCLYGEGYGHKIQSGGKYFINPKEVGFVLFDIKIGNTWLKREDLLKIADQLGIELVPIIGIGTIQESIDYIKTAPTSTFGNRDFVMEGLVIRPEHELLDRRGHRIITKIKVKDFKEVVNEN